MAFQKVATERSDAATQDSYEPENAVHLTSMSPNLFAMVHGLCEMTEETRCNSVRQISGNFTLDAFLPCLLLGVDFAMVAHPS